MCVVFGFKDFWPIVHEQQLERFNAISNLVDLANELSKAAEKAAIEPIQKIVHALTRSTIIGLNELVLLCGNGCGTAAMKIARGLFESSVTAEYLRRNPGDVENYIDFGRILMWRRYQWMLKETPDQAKRIPEQQVKQLEDAYITAGPKFTNAKGRIRNRWSEKTLGQMAEEIGRRVEYEVVYGLGSSIHHVSAEGLLANIDIQENKIQLDAPPSLAWITEALVAGHINLLVALETLNECCNLGFDDRFKTAVAEFHRVWN